ncbi:MAG: hypothetical protein PHU25_05690 [Deltaproteobacteria bacterium]|nr:hypothetical protein [Deltaproteobacteria bacterium]
MTFAIETVSGPNPFSESLDDYRTLFMCFAIAYATRLETLAQMLRRVSVIAREVVPRAEIHGRVKSLRSTLHKVRRIHPDHGRVLDSVGVRIIVPRTRDCYGLFERFRSAFEVVPGEDDDYIRNPKPNGYRGLHTTVVGPNGQMVEIQLRTRWMHAIAEQGTAAHWRYKQLRALPVNFKKDEAHQ